MESVNYSNDPTMTIADIANRLNMSAQFVYRQVKSGTLKSFSIGGTRRKSGAIRVSEQQFQEYLSGQQHQQVTPIATVQIKPAMQAPDSNTVSYQLNQLLNRKKA